MIQSNTRNNMILSDDSQHSTVTVGNGPIKQALSSSFSRPQSPSKRSVRFAECNNQYIDNTSWDAEDCCSAWYAKQDYKSFREEARLQIMTRRAMYNPACGKTTQMDPVVQVLRDVCNVLLQINFVFDKNPMILLASDLQEELLQLFQDERNFELIGLEERISLDMKEMSAERRDRIQDVVYDVQSEHLDGLWTQSQMEVEIMESCLNYSQALCLLAQLVAQAQAAAM